MSLVNRSIVLIRPKPPYGQWMTEGSTDATARQVYEEARRDPTGYLVPEAESETEVEGLIEECWPILFENELSVWSDDESTWPKARTREMFEDWFEVEVGSMVIDLCDWHLEKESAFAEESPENGEG
jgi:hypothetical protein